MTSSGPSSRIKALVVGMTLCMALTAVGCGQASPAARHLTAINVGYGAPSAVYAPIMVAYREGLFEKYGLKPSRPKLLVPPADTAALISGEAQFVDVGPEVIRQDLAGASLEYIATVLPYYPLLLFGPKSIRSVSDLVGKTIAVTEPDTATAYAALTLLKYEHIKGVRLLYVHSVPAIVTALQKGEAQGGLLSAPAMFKAESLGMHEITSMQPLHLPTVMIGVAVERSWARSHTAEVESFLKAYTAGLKECLTNPKATEAALREFLKTTSPSVLARTYTWARASWPAIPLVHKAGIDNLLSLTHRIAGKTVNPNQFYNNSYLKDLEKSGYFGKLYPNGQPPNVSKK